MTEEKQKRRDYQNYWRYNLSPEKQEERRIKDAERKRKNKDACRKYRANLSPEKAEARRELTRQYWKKNREELLRKRAEWKEANREEILLKDKEKQRKIRQERKIKVLTYYSNGTCRCCRCNFDDIRALSIDHIKGGGHQHRKQIGSSRLYQWLIKKNYPEGFQCLCMNCQFIKKEENKELANKND